MKYFLLLFLSLSPIYAISSDIVTLYRTKGIKAVEQEIENHWLREKICVLHDLAICFDSL